MITPSLLPPLLQSDTTARALESLAEHGRLLDPKWLLIYDYDVVDASLLDTLAICIGIMPALWSLCQTPDQQRNLLKQWFELSALKGTKAGLIQAYAVAGFENAVIDEFRGGRLYDGSRTHDNFTTYGNHADSWAWYRVTLQSLINQTQATLAREVAYHFAPARCKLYEIVGKGKLTHNAVASYDNMYTYGSY